MIQLTNQKIKLSFSNNEISSYGGIFLYSEFLENIGFNEFLGKYINFSHHCWRTYSPESLVTQKVLSLIAGYEDNLDSQIIKNDPIFKLSLDDHIGSQPTLSRLENSVSKETIFGFYQANLELLHQAWQKEGRKTITLDLDASESTCYGNQRGSKYHGYYQEVIYHPLYLFCAETGDLLKGMLRSGSCSDHHKAVAFLEPVIDFLLKKGYQVKLRADAGINTPYLYWYLESKGIKYAIRLKKNDRLAKKALELLPLVKEDKYLDKVRFASFSYQADSWSKERQVYVKQVYHSDQLFPEYYFVLSNIQEEAEKIFNFYNKRGTSENYLKEGKIDLFFTRLSCSSFLANAFRFQVAILAYNINNLFRRFILPYELKPNLLSTLRWKIINIGCRIIRHAREIICKFGNNFRQEKFILWIIERLRLFKLCWR